VFYTAFAKWPNFFKFSGYFGWKDSKQSSNSVFKVLIIVAFACKVHCTLSTGWGAQSWTQWFRALPYSDWWWSQLLPQKNQRQRLQSNSVTARGPFHLWTYQLFTAVEQFNADDKKNRFYVLGRLLAAYSLTNVYLPDLNPLTSLSGVFSRRRTSQWASVLAAHTGLQGLLICKYVPESTALAGHWGPQMLLSSKRMLGSTALVGH
jgi:hypothetical protein